MHNSRRKMTHWFRFSMLDCVVLIALLAPLWRVCAEWPVTQWEQTAIGVGLTAHGCEPMMAMVAEQLAPTQIEMIRRGFVGTIGILALWIIAWFALCRINQRGSQSSLPPAHAKNDSRLTL